MAVANFQKLFDHSPQSTPTSSTGRPHGEPIKITNPSITPTKKITSTPKNEVKSFTVPINKNYNVNPYIYTGSPSAFNPYADFQQQDQIHHQQAYNTMDYSSNHAYSQSHSSTDPLKHHLYNMPQQLQKDANILQRFKSNKNLNSTLFLDENLRVKLLNRLESLNLNTSGHSSSSEPLNIDDYHSLVLLEKNTNNTFGADSGSQCFHGYQSLCYKATSMKDGAVYCLRRIKDFRLTSETAMKSLDPWKRLMHANLVPLKEVFTTKSFGDFSLVFVFQYYEESKTLLNEFLMNDSVKVRITEDQLWSFVTQISSVLKEIHSSGLAARVLHRNLLINPITIKIIEPSKILLTGKNRFRLNCLGILDMITFDNNVVKNLPHYQQQDLLQFGQLITVLGCGSIQAVANPQKAFEILSRLYSGDCKKVCLYLLSKPSSFKTIDDVITMLGPRILQEINASQVYNDFLEGELTKELENGRIVRLFMKMGFINERPEYDMDSRWSETGDRYLIKLFRDHVFHQVDENNRPVLDLSHVLYNMNKATS
ncbi:PAB-dependent poly(A)-specific ribonuclease subunit 3 [Clydaea vesicula]|uniref:PAB-dependent poly(A)-specific ribonuclease subunit 3 n=1 Tax=Clydaea vesicula TaxID=447962 RepID=A0AAD5U753_9FUNG|nr:PAB-dependent poly(A)-specific ribonuclease subunit 3 [Clydaea vesicula]